MNPLAITYATAACESAGPDAYWCNVHNSPLGDRSDGWAGCTAALAKDVHAIADAFAAADLAALALVETDYPAYEAAQIEQIEPGLKMSAFIMRMQEIG